MGSTASLKTERNAGIDFLRILSMFYILILHSLGHGGLLGGTSPDSLSYKAVWFLEIIAYCAVDIFALISGYVSYTGKEKKTRYANFFSLWLQTVFYGLLIVVGFQFFSPVKITLSDYKTAFFPVTRQTYWYFTAYTGLFLLMPFLNTAIFNAKESTLRKTAAVIFLAFCGCSMISDAFVLKGGYSFIWIVLLYILGAAIKKCGIGKSIKPYQAGIGIFLLSVFTWLYKMYGITIRFITRDTFVSYVSPTILAMAILYVVCFSKIRFPVFCRKIIGFAAPGAFAVYLLNEHWLVRNNIMTGLFLPIAHQSVIKIVFCVIGFSLLFLIGAILIDRVRIWLFDLCRIKKFAGKLESLSERIITKASTWI